MSGQRQQKRLNEADRVSRLCKMRSPQYMHHILIIFMCCKHAESLPSATFTHTHGGKHAHDLVIACHGIGAKHAAILISIAARVRRVPEAALSAVIECEVHDFGDDIPAAATRERR